MDGDGAQGGARQRDGEDEFQIFGDDQEFIRRMIESMVDGERDLDVLIFDGPERRDDEDKPDNTEENIAEETHDVEWSQRADHIGDALRVGSAEVVLRDVGREAAIQRGLRAARALHHDVPLAEAELFMQNRSGGFSFMRRSSPHPVFLDRYRQDESGQSSSSVASLLGRGTCVSSRKIVLDEIKNESEGEARETTSGYEYDPPLPLGRPPNALPRGYLFCGAKFRGAQRSRSHRFDVEVVIQDVDLAAARLCGTLHTKGLTAQIQELTTFFNGEIISEKYPFVTNKWEADVEADLNHWNKFTGFSEKYGSAFTTKNFDYSRLLNDSVMFMRWKEHYLVDESRNRDVTGASFAGFYYIALDEVTGEIMGFYYHKQSEMYQLLSLKHVDQTSFEGCQIR